MKHKINLTILIILIFSSISSNIYSGIKEDENKIWHGKKCVVVLTYDDALNTHLDNVIPLLDSLGLKATFYISGFFPGFRNRIEDWRSAAKNGHELGNHTLFHPCIGNMNGREWVKSDYDLSKYSIQRIEDEILMNNTVLEAVDGKKNRTFAYPCGDMQAGDSSYVNFISKNFIAARSVNSVFKKINEIDLYNIGCVIVNGQTGNELIEMVKQSMNEGILLVFLFHGVGGEHSINVSLEAHRTLLQFLKQNEKDIWIAPMIEVAKYINSLK